jgi:hypothetical protein
MRKILLAISWLMISFAAAYDGYFAWENRNDLATWEVNPLARWAAQAIGLVAVLVFKGIVLALGAGTALYGYRRNRRLVWSMTAVVGVPYTVLSLYYLSVPAEEGIVRPSVVFLEPQQQPEPAKVLPVGLPLKLVDRGFIEQPAARQRSIPRPYTPAARGHSLLRAG